MTKITPQIEAVMADGVPRTSREIASALGLTGPENIRNINSLVRAVMHRGGFIVIGKKSMPGSKDLTVYVINPDYVPPSKKSAKDKNNGNSARLVVFRSPNESGPGYAYKPQPAIRGQVRFGGISSLEYLG